MSFDVNVLSSKPIIKAASSMQNDGGGGNLGYMAQGEKDENQKRKYLDESIFLKKDESDTFQFNKEVEIPEEQLSFTKLIAELFYYIKNLFIKK